MRNRANLSPMNLTVRKPMTLAEFLAWEERQEQRYEFDGSEPVAMAGGSLAHSAIQRNLAMALGISALTHNHFGQQGVGSHPDPSGTFLNIWVL